MNRRLLRSIKRRPWPWIAAAVLLTIGLSALFSPGDSELRLTFFDVGQGDAAHIRAAEQYDIVIDGGPDERFARQLSRTLAAGDRTIDLLVLTHPHADHLVGLLGVLERYDVREILLTDAVSDSRAFRVWQERIAAEHATIIRAAPHERLVFPGGTLTVLWPDETGVPSLSLNDSSVVLRLDLGTTCALFMGDASVEVEQRLAPDIPRCPILKVGHHGSATSTGDGLLEAMRPEVAIISAGRNNRYGHPAPSTLRRLERAVPQVYRTDLDGAIEIRLNSNLSGFSIRTSKRWPKAENSRLR